MRRMLGLVIAVSAGIFVLPMTLFASGHNGDVDLPAQAQEMASRTGRTVQVGSPPTAPTTTTTVPPTLSDPMLVEVLELVNEERTARGIAPLQFDPLLTQAAQVHSEDQARRNTLTHYGPNGESPGDRIRDTGYVFRTWGENAAMGYWSAASVMNGWMNSSGHKANILNSNFTEIGLGLAYAAPSDGGAPYWTQVFAAPRN